MKAPARVRPCVLVVIMIGLTTAAWSQDADTARKLLAHSSPSYPPLARSMSLAGTVKLQATVAANGTVKSIEVKGGNPLLAQSALFTVREWKWEKSEHESVERVEIHFTP
jgi:TonB family protein